jgi:hypothetical protein
MRQSKVTTAVYNLLEEGADHSQVVRAIKNDIAAIKAKHTSSVQKARAGVSVQELEDAVEKIENWETS